MFLNIPVCTLVPQDIDPSLVPPPTKISLPNFEPDFQHDAPVDAQNALSNLLKASGRATIAMLGQKGLDAVGLNMVRDAKLEQLIPDVSHIPDFDRWEQLSEDQAQVENESTHKPLSNNRKSPGCVTYRERRKELSHSNENGYLTVRRIRPPMGQQPARLGSAYEFFRCLETITQWWNDTTQVMDSSDSSSSDDEVSTEGTAANENGEQENRRIESMAIRKYEGSSMPPEHRQNLITAFIKLAAYDFGCIPMLARVEPRLQLSSPAGCPSRKTFCASGCGFVYQSAMTREDSRAGRVFGPVAATTARGAWKFSGPDWETAQSSDLARELIAALITAQHRNREGKSEVRFGEGQWWSSKPRWGGGSGGPIGREIDKDAIYEDKDTRPTDSEGNPVAKKQRKNMAVYDKYRMVRLPASTWDNKTTYQAIGKQKGTEYDDIFVISSVFHHISVLRFRIPGRLLEVMGGSLEEDFTKRSWGSVQAWRSPWFDLFRSEDRLQALKYIWSMMAYQMREIGDVDVLMTDGTPTS